MIAHARSSRSSAARGSGAGGRDNAWIAARLDEVAELLEAQDANPFRVRAYQRAAQSVRAEREPVRELALARGATGLRKLDGVGESLARSIEELARAGRLALLERLRSGAGAEDALTTVAGIGPELARRIHERLGIEDLYALEAAANDGRLARVPGMGPVRVRAVREALAGRFRRPAVAGAAPPEDEPPVAELLDVDREYRERAAAGTLARIAPRRFNPRGEAWLPVLHTRRGERHYTALFSNTALAHQRGATDDWVVIYRDDHGGHGQWTAVTARRGPHAGQRVVRGREGE